MELRRPVVGPLREECCPILVWHKILPAQQSWICFDMFCISWCAKCFQWVKGLDCRLASLAAGTRSFWDCTRMRILPELTLSWDVGLQHWNHRWFINILQKVPLINHQMKPYYTATLGLNHKSNKLLYFTIKVCQWKRKEKVKDIVVAGCSHLPSCPYIYSHKSQYIWIKKNRASLWKLRPHRDLGRNYLLSVDVFAILTDNKKAQRLLSLI